MVRTTRTEPPRRRLAVIELPRPQPARLGRIFAEPHPIRPAPAWTTISDATPSSADEFIALSTRAQSAAVAQTPGTLEYTPAPIGPASNIPAWNNWLQPNCLTNPAAAVEQAFEGPQFFRWVGLLTGAAAAVYLVRTLAEKRKR